MTTAYTKPVKPLVPPTPNLVTQANPVSEGTELRSAAPLTLGERIPPVSPGLAPSPLERLSSSTPGTTKTVQTLPSPLAPRGIWPWSEEIPKLAPAAPEAPPLAPLVPLSRTSPVLETLNPAAEQTPAPLEPIKGPQSDSNTPPVGWPVLGVINASETPQNQSEAPPAVFVAPPLQSTRTGVPPLQEIPPLVVSRKDEYTYQIIGVDSSEETWSLRGIYTPEFLKIAPGAPGAGLKDKLMLICHNLYNAIPPSSSLGTRITTGHISTRIVIPEGANPFNIVGILEVLDDGIFARHEGEDGDGNNSFVTYAFKVIKYKLNSSEFNLNLSLLP